MVDRLGYPKRKAFLNSLTPPHERGKRWGAVARFLAQHLLEALALVVILGLLPVAAHWLFSLEKPGDTREWIIPELYLFVMMTCGQAVGEAFRDPEGLSRTIVCIAGALGVLWGAGAYGILYVHPATQDARWVEGWLEMHVIDVIMCVGVGYAIYRGIGLFGEARKKMAKKTHCTTE